METQKEIAKIAQDFEETYLNELIDEANKEFTLDKKLAKEVAIKFYKWQEQRMYSEEDMLKSFMAGIKCESNNGQNFEQFINQFKNK